MIDDRRNAKTEAYGFVVCVDKFMSGWGEAKKGRSLYVLAVENDATADIVLDNAEARPEMSHVRFSWRIPSVRSQDHMAIVDRHTAPRWYRPDGFR